MGEPLSPDRVFDFPMDEPQPHPAYDFFAPGPLPGYAGNPNNNNGWIEADVPLLGKLGDEADEPMVGLLVGEIAEPIVEMEEQVIARVIDMEEDITMLFGDGDFSEDEEEVWEVNEEWLMAPVTPPLMPVVPPPSRLCPHRAPTSMAWSACVEVFQGSDAEVADGITIGEIGLRVSAVKGQCILGMDRRLADLERRPPGPQ
ncbi:hypothetical protein Tco_0272199 [Tanacetum coccineum]